MTLIGSMSLLLHTKKKIGKKKVWLGHLNLSLLKSYGRVKSTSLLRILDESVRVYFSRFEFELTSNSLCPLKCTNRSVLSLGLKEPLYFHLHPLIMLLPSCKYISSSQQQSTCILVRSNALSPASRRGPGTYYRLIDYLLKSKSWVLESILWKHCVSLYLQQKCMNANLAILFEAILLKIYISPHTHTYIYIYTHFYFILFFFVKSKAWKTKAFSTLTQNGTWYKNLINAVDYLVMIFRCSRQSRHSKRLFSG